MRVFWITCGEIWECVDSNSEDLYEIYVLYVMIPSLCLFILTKMSA